MNQARFEQELQLNRQAYEQLRDEIRKKYPGRYVAIAHGRVVSVAESFDAASAVVMQLQPTPEHFVVFEGDQDPLFEIVDDFHLHASIPGT